MQHATFKERTTRSLFFSVLKNVFYCTEEHDFQKSSILYIYKINTFSEEVKIMSKKDERNKARHVCFSMTLDTYERLKQYAYENHTSASHALTELIWRAPVKNAQVRGQMSLGGK